MAAIARAADDRDHHPDVDLRYPGVVLVGLQTHTGGGVTQLDVDLARAISGLAADAGATVPEQLEEPRPVRNRIHFDITVPPNEADARIEAALAAGGRLVSAERARAFWILADPDGNEVCVCTWQDRD